MKNLIASFIIFIVMVSTVFFSINYLNSACKKLNVLNTQIEKSIEEDSWNEAYDKSLKLLDTWDGYTRKLSVFVNHCEIDNLNNEIWKLTQYTKCHNKDESLASNTLIKFLFEHIVNMEKINMQNIF
jgi:hypothetical protein